MSNNPLIKHLLVYGISKQMERKSCKAAFNKLVDEELQEELESLGFQVKVNNIWYRFSDCVVSMFSIRPYQIEVDIYPMYCKFSYPYGSPRYPTWRMGIKWQFGPMCVPMEVKKKLRAAETDYRVYYDTKKEAAADAKVRALIQEYWGQHIKPIMIQCANLDGVFRYLDQESSDLAQFLLNSEEYLQRGETLDIEILEMQTVRYRDDCEKSFLVECAIRNRFDEGVSWARKKLEYVPDNKVYAESLDILQRRDKEACYAFAREIFQENLETIKTRFPKKKIDQLPTLADLEKYLV